MKFAHTITITVFVKSGENDEAIKKALLSIVPLDLEKEKIKLNRIVAKANLSGQSDIIIYELMVDKERHTKKVIDLLKEKLAVDDRSALASQENRVDDDCFFYMRLDKKKLIAGEFELTDSGECFHIKMSVAAFPKKREAALGVVKKMWA